MRLARFAKPGPIGFWQQNQLFMCVRFSQLLSEVHFLRRVTCKYWTQDKLFGMGSTELAR
jgi:hypothetical protein